GVVRDVRGAVGAPQTADEEGIEGPSARAPRAVAARLGVGAAACEVGVAGGGGIARAGSAEAEAARAGAVVVGGPVAVGAVAIGGAIGGGAVTVGAVSADDGAEAAEGRAVGWRSVAVAVRRGPADGRA